MCRVSVDREVHATAGQEAGDTIHRRNCEQLSGLVGDSGRGGKTCGLLLGDGSWRRRKGKC
jgi:hypothetical protein